MTKPLWMIDDAPITELAGYLRGAVEMARKRGHSVPDEWVPTPAELKQLIEAAFWASMIPDEGRSLPRRPRHDLQKPSD